MINVLLKILLIALAHIQKDNTHLPEFLMVYVWSCETSVFAELLPSKLTKVTVLKKECCFDLNSVEIDRDFTFFS